MHFPPINSKRAIVLTNKGADGIILLSDAADLASQVCLQCWSQCSKVPLCQRFVDLTADLRADTF